MSCDNCQKKTITWREHKIEMERIERCNARLFMVLLFIIVLLVVSWIGFLQYRNKMKEQIIIISEEKDYGMAEIFCPNLDGYGSNNNNYYYT